MNNKWRSVEKSCNTVIICASGPSLIKKDCDLVCASGHTVIAVNSTWLAIPDCDYIYSTDYNWWHNNINLLPPSPERWTSNRKAFKEFSLNLFPIHDGGTFNSGQRAILFSAQLGAKNIILLGYDCSINNGIHWHGTHSSSSNPDVSTTIRWQREFEVIGKALCNDIHIINCSRYTEITCFRRLPLELALAEIAGRC
ncbi:hypothetical protein [Kluyvera intermedia]|uniref:hypothetical protein n=1 Tax=Kluyvera intermedia TaxID=61648 RepID=UPI00352675D3